MADNTILSTNVGTGDTIRDKDRSGVKTQVAGLDINVGGASEVLMTAAALADATANPTTFLVGALLQGYNGTTWDRLQVDASKFLKVNVAAALPAGGNVIGAVTQSGTWTAATNADAGVGAGAAPAKALLTAGVFNSTLPTLTTGQTAGVQVDSSGRILVGSVAGTVTVSGTVTANQGTAAALAGYWPVRVTDGTNTMPTGDAAARTIHVTVDNATLAVTESGTWTVATNADAALAAGTAPSKCLVIGAQYNSSAPAPTTGQTVALQTDSSGNLKVNVASGSTGNAAAGNTGSAVPAQADYAGLNVGGTLRGWTGVNPSGSVYAAQCDLTSVAGTTVATAASGVAKVGVVGNAGGAFDAAGQNAASPANQLLVGGQFNTSPTTISSGNMSPLQLDSSGNLLVNLKANSFGTVTVTATNLSTNVAQFGGNAVATGTGAGGAGIPRVTVSNDSQVKVWDGTNTTAVKAAQTSPALADPAAVVAVSPNNSGLPVNLPAVVQKTSNASSGSVASLAKAFASNNTAGNSIVVVCAVGNGTAPTISDTAGNNYKQAAQVANGTAFNSAVFVAVNVAAGANTVTVNNGGSTASIAMEIYEVSGLLAQSANQPSVTATNTGSSGTASTAAITAVTPNEMAFAAVGVGTAAQTITPGSGWANDSGQQNPTTPAGLFSFVSMSQPLGSLAAVTPQATFTSEPWALAVATFRPVILGVEGTVNVAQFGGASVVTGTGGSGVGVPRVTVSNDSKVLVWDGATTATVDGNASSNALCVTPKPTTSGGPTQSRIKSAASTNATSVKASAGQLYALDLTNNTASMKYLKLYNKASAPTVGTDTPAWTVGIPANGGRTIEWTMGVPFSTGIAYAITGAITDADTTATAADDVHGVLLYR